MTDTKFTPGPWGPDTRVPVRGNALQLEFLCAVDPDSPRDIEARANGRLIAAAPDLYAAVVEVIDMVVSEYGPLDDAENPARWGDEDMFELYGRLSAALAKARGEA